MLESRPTFGKKRASRHRVSATAELSNEEFWLRRWSFARYTLRLSDPEFWDSTPRSLDALADRLLEERKLDDWRTALLTSTLINVSPYRGKEGVSPNDFMPRYEDDEPEPEKVDNDMKKKLASINLTSIITGLYQRQQKNAGVTNGS